MDTERKIAKKDIEVNTRIYVNSWGKEPWTVRGPGFWTFKLRNNDDTYQVECSGTWKEARAFAIARAQEYGCYYVEVLS